MKITASEEYGLRIILCIAKISQEKGSKTLVTLNEIAQNEGMTNDYVANILSKLREANLVESIRGKNGGYKLKTETSNISLFHVLRSLDAKAYSQDFCETHSAGNKECSHSEMCSIRPIWQTVTNILDNVFLSITLEDLLQSEDELLAKFDGAKLVFDKKQVMTNV